MTTAVPKIISDDNLSNAWARAFIATMRAANTVTPLIISVTGLNNGSPVEDDRIRKALDLSLERSGKYSCAISAMTIFPYKFWIQLGRPHIKEFSEQYLSKYLPRLRARDLRNRTGTYFERMIAFKGTLRNGNCYTRNQLQHVIELWKNCAKRKGPRPRQSALQVAVFDPVKDQNGAPRSVFPCLHQVSFAYDDSGGLAVNAYYPTQYIFDRGYGNYLGLCHLGYFMGQELDLQLVRMNCFIGRPHLGAMTKTALRNLERLVDPIVCKAV